MKMAIRSYFLLLTSSFLPLAVGCAQVQRLYEPHPVAAAIEPLMPQAQPAPPSVELTAGSLWSPETQIPWFANDKAQRRGDTVLVRVLQKTSGTKQANTDTKRESSITAKILYWFGLEDNIGDLAGYDDPNQNLIEAQSSREFSGQGSTERSDTLQATVSAIVTDVLRNGNLVVYGHQTVTLNSEASVLTVQGIVRPSDIDDNNSIDSTRIANARIEFTGSGVVNDTQHPGWAMRIFDWVWPF
jgi:flagellar L-ring protein precursor FlgH